MYTTPHRQSMTGERTDSSLTIKQVIAVLSQCKINLRKSRSTAGEVNWKEEVWLEPSMDILSTAVHEAIHILDRSLTEDKVLALEAKITKKMTIAEWKQLLEVVNNRVNRR